MALFFESHFQRDLSIHRAFKLLLAKLFPKFLKLPVFKKKSWTTLHGFRRDNENEERGNIFVTCWLHEYTSTRRKSHLYEVYTKNFTISLSISLLITQSMSMELLRIFSSA